MVDVNPYEIQPGTELDQLIHRFVMKQEDTPPAPYSTSEEAARQVLARLKAVRNRTVVMGRTGLRNRKWFARYETDASDGTEVLAETLPLAICRLALLRAIRNEGFAKFER